ncbi:MAG: alpha/beta hydrolase, partial [Bdellovibrionales bacterium]|nr:alpha/beta hydrolase [Bdellovibrionales bacterium]
FDVHSLAGDVVENVRSLGLEPVSLVGHSTGGIIGAVAMAQAPDLFQRAVLLDPVAATGIQFGPEMYAAFEAMSRDENLCATVILSTMHDARLPDEYRKRIAAAAYGVHPRLWRGVPDMLNTLDVRELLRSVKAPTLVLHGEHDTLLPMAGSEELARLIPGAGFHRIPGRGHCTNVEDPALFVELTSQHLFGH